MAANRFKAALGLLALGIVALLVSKPVLAADETIQAILSEAGSWESNPLMQTSGAKALYGSTTSPEMIFKDETPTLKLNSDTLINGSVFNQSSFNTIDGHETFGFTDQATPRWNYGVNAKADYDTTRSSELSSFGLTANKVFRHTGLSVSPDVSFNPTPIDQMTLKGTAALSNYEGNLFTDYNVYNVDPTYAHNFDPLNAGTFDVLIQRYATTSGPKNNTDTISPAFGWQSILTPRMTIRFGAGPQFTRLTGSINKDWSLSYNFSGDLTYKGTVDTLDVTASRNEYPFGNGTEALSTIFGVTDKHNINDKFAVNGGLTYQTADYQSNTPLSLDTLAGGNAGLTYHATEHIDVNAAYQYRHETYTSTSATADDHLATLSLSYRPTEWGL